MALDKSFWIHSAPEWENRRYRGFFSKIFFSSLKFRRQYLLFILNQLPKGASVLEIGCGSGLLFAELQNKSRLQYTGIDISPSAIATAQKRFAGIKTSKWHCASISEISGQKFDFVVSAGLLDWVSDEMIINFLSRNQTLYHVHSFSEKRKSLSTEAHLLFSKLVSRNSGIKYEPRKFHVDQIRSNFATFGNLHFVRNRKLSFGAFVHNLPDSINCSFESMLVAEYFILKSGVSAIEAVFKKAEMKAVKACVAVAGKRVMEAGSGQGQYSRWLFAEKPSELLCVDAYVATPEFVPEILGYFQKMPAEKIQAGPFDVILALGVLEFVSDRGAFLQHLLGMTAPAGTVVMLIPRETSAVSRIYRFLHRLRGITVPQNLDVFLTEQLAQHPRKTSFEKIGGGPLNFLFIIKVDEKNIIRS